MHDAKGRPLQIGDKVLIPAIITDLGPSEEFCNVNLWSALGRRPDWHKEYIRGINTGVLLRSNIDDVNDINDDSIWAS